MHYVFHGSLPRKHILSICSCDSGTSALRHCVIHSARYRYPYIKLCLYSSPLRRACGASCIRLPGRWLFSSYIVPSISIAWFPLPVILVCPLLLLRIPTGICRMLVPRMSSSTRSTSLSNVSTYSYYNKALFTRATTVVLVLVVAQLGTILYCYWY